MFNVIVFLCAGLFFLAPVARAERVYVTDSFDITFRRGPSVEHKVLRTLKSGQPVILLETNQGWSRVRLAGQSDEETEGWVLSRYLMQRVPWENQAQRLKHENARLSEELNQIRGKWNDLSLRDEAVSSELKQKSRALRQLQNDFQTLKRESADFLKLKKAYESNRAELDATLETAEKLRRENEKLRSSQRNRWFISGALVLICGLIIGLIMGSRQKKRKALYY
jgi:SH3 domain protein